MYNKASILGFRYSVGGGGALTPNLYCQALSPDPEPEARSKASQTLNP